ncbi:MAG: hypothetical protein EAZ08_01915 [Cytophagales bacterium]|nr:MAG: hypothetical protein EAZ08_01915 [Cytophagales bacterium]
MEIHISYINTFFNQQPDATLIEEFAFLENRIKGKIAISTSKSILEFDVVIPLSFPLGNEQSCIKFVCEDLKGYPHINLDLSICLHSIPSANFQERFENEFNTLREWIKDFYIDEKTEEHYYYLNVPYERNPFTLLFNDAYFNPKKNERGYFEYSDFSLLTLINHIGIIQKIHNVNLQWSKNIKELPKLEGIWIYIEKEPVVQRRQIVESWSELGKYLTQDNYSFIFNEYLANTKRKEQKRFMFLLVGYKIIQKGKGENHWDLIVIDLQDVPPIEKKYEKQIGNIYQSKNKKILWHKTSNVSYNRFFGRGKLSDKITEKNILLIGTGAIGSNIAKILTRGGAKNLTLIDFDTVETGNVCRSEFNISHTLFNKADILKYELLQISPHININNINHIDKRLPNSTGFEEVKKYLSQFDIIFDCSTDNEISLMLDKMQFRSIIFCIFITNKARELLCLTGNEITETSYAIVKSIYSENQPITFYEGAGCQYPTFEASYVDIHSLVLYAFRNIDYCLDKEITPRNFIIKTNAKADSFSLNLFNFQEFIQGEADLRIIISQEVIDEITQLSLKYYPNEFGGILIGYFMSNGKNVIITQIITPSKYNIGKLHFERFGDNINELLIELHKNTNGEFVYVGEWHTHPNSSPHYSSTDFNAMKNIAEDKNIHTNNPILLINGFNKNNHNLQFYVYKNTKLYPYEKI